RAQGGDAVGGERAAPSPLAARLVPYGFARSGQILVAHQHPDSLEVWISERTSEAALAEVARNFGERGFAGALTDPHFQAVRVLMSDQDLAAAGKAVGHEPSRERRGRGALTADGVAALRAMCCLRGRRRHGRAPGDAVVGGTTLDGYGATVAGCGAICGAGCCAGCGAISCTGCWPGCGAACGTCCGAIC